MANEKEAASTEVMQSESTGLVVRSPKKLAKPKPGEPPMDINRLALYHDEPTDGNNVKYAKELLLRCGPLILDGIQYSVDLVQDKIIAVPREFIKMERSALASGIDKLQYEKF